MTNQATTDLLIILEKVMSEAQALPYGSHKIEAKNWKLLKMEISDIKAEDQLEDRKAEEAALKAEVQDAHNAIKQDRINAENAQCKVDEDAEARLQAAKMPDCSNQAMQDHNSSDEPKHDAAETMQALADAGHPIHAQIEEWLIACQKLIDQDHHSDHFLPAKLSIQHGRKYAKIISINNGGKDEMGKSVWAFIHYNSGDVLKAASRQKPAKHARGNLNDEFKGMRWMTSMGPSYLR